MEQRIYLNSYMMKTSGDDTEFELDLGAQYEFNSIQLDQAVIENQFLNFYESWNTDFSTVGLTTLGGLQVKFTIQHYLESWADFIAYFNAKNGQGLVMQDVVIANNYQQILQFRISLNGAFQQCTLFPGAWEKLGFEIGIQRNQHTATRSYDLGQSVSVVVSFENIPNCFKSKYGQFSFVIPNTSPFGGRIFYQSSNDLTCQHIKLPYQVSVNKLKIRLSNCDLKKLMTSRQGAATFDNQNGIECIFVFTIKNI